MRIEADRIIPLESVAEWPSQPKDLFEAALAITFCKGMLPPVRQHLIVETIAREFLDSDPNILVVGTGILGMVVAGLLSVDNDGASPSHGLLDNDYDLFIIGKAPTFRKRFEQGAQKAIDQIRQHKGVAHWTEMRVVWSLPSLWGTPPYLKVQVQHGQTGDWDKVPCYETLHIHYCRLDKNYSIRHFLRDYAPWWSTKVGLPLFLGRIDENGNFSHYLWNPYPSIRNGGNNHYVRITAPEIFTKTPRSILQITRIALGVIQATTATGVPARIHPEDFRLMEEVITRHADALTKEQRASAKRRLKTILYRARQLEHYALGPGSEFYDQLKQLPRPRDQISQILDQVSWGKRVLGASVRQIV